MSTSQFHEDHLKKRKPHFRIAELSAFQYSCLKAIVNFIYAYHKRVCINYVLHGLYTWNNRYFLITNYEYKIHEKPETKIPTQIKVWQKFKAILRF